MEKRWRSQFQRVVQQQLARGGLQQVRSANDFGDAHGGIIGDHCKLVGGNVVTAPDEEVPEVPAGGEGLWAAVEVGETECRAVRHAEAPVHTCGKSSAGGLVAAAAGVNGLVIQLAFVGSGSGFGKVFARAGAGVDETLFFEGSPSAQVESAALALNVWRVRTADVGALLPADAEPEEVFEHRIGVGLLGALRVEIFVAEDKGALGGKGAFVGGPERAGVSDVKIARGGRRDAAAIMRHRNGVDSTWSLLLAG